MRFFDWSALHGTSENAGEGLSHAENARTQNGTTVLRMRVSEKRFQNTGFLRCSKYKNTSFNSEYVRSIFFCVSSFSLFSLLFPPFWGVNAFATTNGCQQLLEVHIRTKLPGGCRRSVNSQNIYSRTEIFNVRQFCQGVASPDLELFLSVFRNHQGAGRRYWYSPATRQQACAACPWKTST